MQRSKLVSLLFVFTCSLREVFYFENLPDSLCCFCAPGGLVLTGDSKLPISVNQSVSQCLSALWCGAELSSVYPACLHAVSAFHSKRVQVTGTTGKMF